MSASNRYAPIEAWLREEIGLDAASIGPSTIALAANGRMAARKINDVAEYAALVMQSRLEAQQLIEAIVVPETSFFRDQHPFVVLKQWAKQEWMPTQTSGVMRLLSMPCSTGEEPFSMAMSLLEEGVVRFLVEGVDISNEALSKAEKGVYRRNSFRGGMREGMARFFAAQGDGEWCISDEVRKHVRFRQANLLDRAFGEGSPLYDVIFCRNLLIYLDAAAQRTVMEKIEALLAPEGLLCVGHAEAYLFSQFGFEPSGASMAFCFRKPRAGRQAHQEAVVERKPFKSSKISKPLVDAMPGVLPGAFQLPRPPVVAPLPPVPTLHPGGLRSVAPEIPASQAAEATLDECQRLADSGVFERAEELALAHIGQHGPSPRAFYLLALLCDAQERGDEAAAYYRKTLYLEPEHTEALAHLSLFLRQRGDTRGAEQLQRRLLRVEKQGGLQV